MGSKTTACRNCDIDHDDDVSSRYNLGSNWRVIDTDLVTSVGTQKNLLILFNFMYIIIYIMNIL